MWRNVDEGEDDPYELLALFSRVLISDLENLDPDVGGKSLSALDLKYLLTPYLLEDDDDVVLEDEPSPVSLPKLPRANDERYGGRIEIYDDE